MEQHDHLPPDAPSAHARRAIERLLDQQELEAGQDAVDERLVRRRCGRWLLMRRLSRGLSLEAVAARVGAEAEWLRMLELGLAERPPLPDEAWARLSLVLEGEALDYRRVSEVIDVAIGALAPPGVEWIAAVDAELSAGEPAALPAELLQGAGKMLEAATNGKLPPDNTLVLEVLRQAGERPLSLAEIKLRVQDTSGVSLRIVYLRDLLVRLGEAQLLTRADDEQQPAYRITLRGRKALEEALRETRVRLRLVDLLGGPSPLGQGV